MTNNVDWYDEHSDEIINEYNAIDAEPIYEWTDGLLPEAPALVADIGASTGRDAV